MFIRHESFRLFLKQYPVTSVLLAVITAIFLFFFIGSNIAPSFFNFLFYHMVGVNFLILNGNWWQLITPVFLHITFPHFLFNAFTVLIIAPALEMLLGRLKFTVAFVGTGIISNLVALFLEDPYFSHYGASAAVFGLMGIYLYMIVFRPHLMTRQDRTIMIVMLALNVIGSFMYPNIDVLGHFTGLLAGFTLAPILFSGRRI